ncbi:NAD(P)-dependent alcohol dehydrogenase [Isoptericola croceus]|uniref:NAD(P)-dependent alcohol dehydrogenase n=1 Tax=Isoptericola croceus TaxID=3031406 RepID=UPI0023F848DA|nr:NAD(P)-dependent alcohol dehydrogenase [Isoptericola croceus]
MRAIVQDRYGDARVLRLADVEVPTPGRGEVLLRVRAATLDASVWYKTTGRPVVSRLAFGLRRPRERVAGQEVAGTVAAVGPGVEDLTVGDEVFGVAAGSFAELAVARADRLAHRPAEVPPESAAALAVSGVTALQAVRRAEVRPGQRVLVTGAGGGVGTFVVGLATDRGAEVTAVAGPDKADLVTGLGARHLDYTREPLASAGRHDAVIDVSGNRPLRDLRHSLSARGTLVLVGAGVTTSGFLGGAERMLLGAVWSPFVPQRLRGLTSVTRRDDLDTLASMVATGHLHPVVDRVCPLEQAPAAVRELGAGHARGKTAIVP